MLRFSSSIRRGRALVAGGGALVYVADAGVEAAGRRSWIGFLLYSCTSSCFARVSTARRFGESVAQIAVPDGLLAVCVPGSPLPAEQFAFRAFRVADHAHGLQSLPRLLLGQRPLRR